jgi:beta-glucanase (GH16 family)
MQTVVAYIMAIIMTLSGILGSITGIDFGNKEIDLDEFSLVWSDEFDGDAIDPESWKGVYGGITRAVMRKGGYIHSDLAEVKDGNLHIYTKYLENGTGGGPAGYYSYMMYTRDFHEQKYGYFEVRCILPKGAGQWAAFWMNSRNMENVDGSAADGAEIDIFESPYYHKKLFHNYVSSNVYYDGYGEDIVKGKMGIFEANNPYEEYNTYGLEWNENEYIFYINGKETARTDFGVSQSPEYLILSVEVGGSNGVPDPDSWAGDMSKNEELPSDFVVDYVRAYQYKDLV